MREALQDLGMLHASNPPSRIATVSLGGAAHVPAHGASERAAPLTAADRALCAAKDNDRDRLVMAGQVVAWPGARSA